MKAIIFPQKIILFSVNPLTGKKKQKKTTCTFATLLHKWINIINIKLSFHIETKKKCSCPHRASKTLRLKV